jgi:serine/threonine-protein kinase
LQHGRNAELLLGSYVLLDRIGAGGMGQVYKARNWKMNRIAALKVIRKERLDKPETVQRFYREARAAAQLNHPNVVLAYDADEVNGTHYFAMEYVEGNDLAQLVKQKGPLPVEQACDYVRQAALGLQHAFERGLVHRDIKPSNLLVTMRTGSQGGQYGTVKILDMGLARLAAAGPDSVSELTVEGAFMGTPDYIAPEQTLDSRTVDIRADLYSLGCTWYYLLTGLVPFPGGTFGEKLLKHQLHYPVPVEQLRPEVSAPVAALLTRLIAKRPEDRCQTPAELVAVLDTLFQPAAAGARSGSNPDMGLAGPPGIENWEAITASNPFPLSRPNRGAPASAAGGETQTSNSSVVEVRSGKPALQPQRGPAGDRRRLFLGIGIGGFIGLVVVGILFALFLPGRKPAIPPGSGKGIDDAKGPVYLSDLPEMNVLPGLAQFSKKGKLSFLPDQPLVKVKGTESPKAVVLLPPPAGGLASASYKIGGKYKVFEATVALDDSAGAGKGSTSPFVFSLWPEGWPKPLWESKPLQKCGDTDEVRADINGIDRLKLEVKSQGPNSSKAPAVWLEPRISK